MQKYTDPITPEFLLDALNGKYDFGARRRELAHGLTAPEGEYAKAAEKFTSRLRSRVDMWLRTGFTAHGAENASLRKPTTDITQLVSSYVKKHHAFATFEKGRGFSAAVPFQIEEQPVIDWKGFRAAIRDDLPSADPIRAIDQPLAAAEEAADRIFVGMLFNPDCCTKIAKCRREACGRYYLLPRPRHEYRRGTYCRKCNSNVSARRCMAAVRAERQRRLCQIAAAFVKAKSRGRLKWYEDVRFKKRIAIDLNQKINGKAYLRRLCQPVSAKWVTRNRKNIEAEL